MEIEICEEFYYRICDKKEDVFQKIKTINKNFVRNNNEIELFEGEWVKVKTNEFIVHHVRPAETLQDIAKFYNSSVDKIKKDNNLSSTKLFIGQMIKILKNNN